MGFFHSFVLRVETWLLLLFILYAAHATFAQTGSVVSINDDKVLVVNGRKVFPITLSPGPPTGGQTPTGADALEELHSAGAFMFRISQSGNWTSELISNQQAALDWAAQHGMYCMVNLRELSAFASGDTNTEASLRSVVNLFKNHPALGVWKNKDEAWWGGVSADNLKRGYDVIKQEDPYHPIEQTHAPRGTVQDLQPYNAAADIIAVDIYPVSYPPGANSLWTNKEISMIGDYADFLSQIGNREKHFWLVEQIAWSGVTPPNKTLRFPTKTEERFMAYQAVIHGARGLMFFGGNVTAALNPRDAALGWNWTFWDEVLKPVVAQLGENSLLTDALVAPDSLLPIQVSRPDVEFCVRDVPPYLYILACKREGVTTNVTFSGLPSSAGVGELLYESPRIVNATNGAFTDWFGPFEVHAYRFLITNQSPIILSQPPSQTVYIGATATFSVTATGSGTLTYQWWKNGSTLSDGGNVSGASSPVLTLTNVTSLDAGSYEVVVSGIGSVTSAPPAVLTTVTNIIPPTITSQPQSRTNIAGTMATFAVVADGSGPFAYQWTKNGVTLTNVANVSGATSPSLTLFSVSQSDAATYRVIVNGVGGVTNSLPATLTVTQTAPLILYEPFDYPNIGAPVSSNVPAYWTYNGSGGNDLNVTAGSLSYSGLMTSIGNSVTNGGVGLGVRRLFGSTISTGAVYFSALFRINEFGGWGGSPSSIGALTAPDNTNFRLSVIAALTSPTNYILGMQKGGSAVVYDGYERMAGETVFLVGKYDFTVSPNRVSLWVNPDASTFGAASEPTNGVITTTGGSDGYTIDRFNMRQNTVSSVPGAMQWDELRFGYSWGDVTPPGPVIPVVLTNVVQLADGTFQFSYSDSSSQSYSIYASADMATWTPVGMATRVGPTLYQFNDTSSTNYAKRFYQLRRP